jgi:tetratricopeptide (TPR) repeat protein
MDYQAASIEDLLRLAKEDLARNSLTSAERVLEQAILLNNQIPEAFHLLGYVYSKKGKFKKAITSFERALSLDPFYTESAIALSSLYNDVGKYKEGAEVFFKTKKRLDKTLPGHDPQINESLARRHHDLGLLYMRFERFQEAYHEFSKALHLYPDEILYAVYMAKCLSKTGDKEAAVQLLKKSLQTHPKSIEAKIQLGVMHHSLGRLNDAHREWTEAAVLDPDNSAVQMYLKMFETAPLTENTR